jgi:Spy/CpxP family protein refolding chaperone
MLRRPLIAATLILALAAAPAVPVATAAAVTDPIAHMAGGPHAPVQLHRSTRRSRPAGRRALACPQLARLASTPGPRLRNLGCQAAVTSTARRPARHGKHPARTGRRHRR